MNMHRLLSLLLLAITCLACGPNTSTVQAPSEPALEASTDEAEPRASLSRDALMERLRARHVEDLPDAEDLAYEGADEALVWIASNADTMVVRARALGLLQHTPTPESLSFLKEQLTNPELHPTLRAGSIRALEGHLGADSVLSLLVNALRDSDPRVAHAAASVLATDPGYQAVLMAASKDPAVNADLRARIQDGKLVTE